MIFSHKELLSYFPPYLKISRHNFSHSSEVKFKRTLKDEDLDFLNNIPTNRKKDWISSRFALWELIHENSDLVFSQMIFPHKNYSISHSKGEAFAVTYEDTSETKDICGIGIDFERDREIDKGVSKFFINEKDEKALGQKKENLNLEQRQKLWTIKEALFKSDGENENSVINDYFLKTSDLTTGKAEKSKNSQFQFEYYNLYDDGLCLSVAICRKVKTTNQRKN